MHFKNVIGIDVSKAKFDLALIKGEDLRTMVSAEFENSRKGIVHLEEFIKKNSLQKDETLICMEHTGIYCRLLSQYLTEQQYHVWLEMPVQIIRSLGLQRGKNDKIDARRIAEYAYQKRDQAVLWEPPREVLQKIHDLLALRDRLCQARTMLNVPIQEYKQCGFEETADMVKQNCKSTLTSLDKEIVKVEQEIEKMINNDDNLNKKYNLARSVPGIGKITAMFLLYYTNEFKQYNNAKQLACYCGVAPFTHMSGTSVRGKTRVSNFANKQIKKLLHLAAMSAIRTDSELQAYYKRKVGEGKNAMSVLNAVRNKLILRICAVISRGYAFQLDYHYA